MQSSNSKRPIHTNISPQEYQLIQQLRERSPAQKPVHHSLSLGERLSDRVASIVGSWNFIVCQSVSLVIWIIFNVVGAVAHWDPYPFILLNLMLSFQAAYTAPIIMMSQNRQAQIDRQDARYDYEVNLKAELEIELLHDKINLLREQEMVEVLQLLKAQQEQINQLEKKLDMLVQKQS